LENQLTGGPSLPHIVLLGLGGAKFFDVKDAQTAIIPCAKEVQPQMSNAAWLRLQLQIEPWT
jgi:hypothetical protein